MQLHDWMEHLDDVGRGVQLVSFIAESNKIEGIHRLPSGNEIEVHRKFLKHDKITPARLKALVAVCQPNAVFRDSEDIPGVRVGRHIAPPSGPKIVQDLKFLLNAIHAKGISPHEAHCEYETLHPFTDGNGRSGRALWLWHMQYIGQIHRALSLGFLHEFYYQTLAASAGQQKHVSGRAAAGEDADASSRQP